MKILVTASSKHGATREVAERISDRLRSHDFDVEMINPEDVKSLESYDAVVCGSAVYMTQWMAQANDFMERFRPNLLSMPVWAFSVGLSGVPKQSLQDPSRIGPVLMKVPLVHHQKFPGRYDPSRLSLRERTIARLAGAVEGDFRPWDEVDQWADEIAQDLKSGNTAPQESDAQ